MARKKQSSSSSKPKASTSRKRTGAYNRRRGNSYELKIVKELKELGYEGVVTSRSESKRADNDKIDIVDTNNELPVSLQIKKTIATPNYFKIRNESSASNNKFVVIWAKQKAREKNMCTIGEMVMMDKRMFYELLRIYKDGKSKNNRDSGNSRQQRHGTDQ